MKECNYCRRSDSLGYMPDKDGHTPGEGWVCTACAKHQRDEALAEVERLRKELEVSKRREADAWGYARIFFKSHASRMEELGIKDYREEIFEMLPELRDPEEG